MSQSEYNGTLFRFPLRQEPSPDLSANVVSSQRIRDLFESFQADAHLVLLFLKTVEMISIYEWLPGKPAACEVFKVCLSEAARAVVHRERESILSSISAATRADGRVKSGFVLSRCYQASITCTLQQVTITQQWLVENYISTTNPEVHSMAAKLAQIPWVGLAVPIGRKTKHGENLGRIFCFLPLPPSDDADSNSGLPVHVHGSFSVADNRRSLKWPAEDRTKDEKAEWNRLLVEQLIALAYTSLIQHAIELDREVVSVTDIYAMWPDIEHVQYHWSLYVVPSLLSSLSKLKVLHGESASGNFWERVGDVLVCNNSGNTLSLAESVAIEEMKRIGHKVTFPATNVASCLARIESDYGVSCKRICPEVIRVELKKSNRYQNMQPRNKIQLLKYVLSDRRFNSLVGLHLLPLADRTFTSFSYQGYSAAVYLESSSCPRSLFPGQDGKFLDQDIDRGVCTILKEVATTSHTQLKNIQRSDVPPLISEVLSSVWRHGCGAVIPRPHTVNRRLTDGWLEELWGWINRNTFNIPLSKFEHMYLVPVTSTSGVKNLMQLAPLPALFAEVPGVDVRISKELAKGLESLGCTVLYQPSSYLVSCSHVYNYICMPVQILTCISRAGVSSSKYQSLALAQKRELLSVVSSALQVCHPSRAEINVLKSLPVFRVWGGQNLVSLSHCSQVAPVNLEETLPIVANLVASPNLASRQILQYFSKNFNYFELTLEEVMIKFVFNQFNTYSVDAKENLIKFCLDNIYIMSSDARRTIASLPFVRTGDGQLKAPNAVFNPSERHVSELYGDQCVFAVGSFATNSKYGKLLHQCIGLRKLSDISANELYVLAERIAAKKSKSMGKTLLEVLHTEDWAQRLLLAQTYRHGWVTCWQALAAVDWMPVIEHSSSIMPFGMPWASSSPTCLPCRVVVPSDDLSSERLQLTVGTQLAILDYASVISPSIVKFLSCASLSTMYEAVIKQLIVAHKLWKAKSIKESGREEFDRMLQEVFSTLGCAFSSSFATVILDGLKSAPADWVWLNGSQGFVRSEQLAVSSTFPVPLEPWLCEIGHYPHLNACSTLLKKSGMKSKFEKEDILCVLPSMKAFYDSSTIQVEPKKMGRDLELTIAILNWLTRDGSILSRNLQQNLLVPVDREDNVLELCPCSELMYCDAECLRRSDDLEVADYRLIHKQVSSDTAYKLGVPSLSNRLAPSEELPFEQLGPHESLTLRLKNILKEYKDDAGIFKELLQNADDAEATSVKFLVDWREHDQFRSSLLAPGMSKCQGPALWAFNDSVFSDEDFVNISKLAAATKQSKLEKIGRFGLGFTSVYHITDVPSFVSRRYVVIFDPHKSHLGNHIRNPSQPGIKIDFVQRPIGQRFKDQFQPYVDVFGCNLVERAEFNGTLFRFPFRTNEQAAVNEIKNEAYDEDRVKASLRALQEVCGKLLIFLQHVKSVEVFELKSDAISPSDMRQILSVQAGAEASSSLLSHQELLTSVCRQVERGRFENTAGCSSTCAIKWRNFHTDEVHSANWLVCSEGGKGDAFQFSMKHGGRERGFVPFAGVAVELQADCLPCAIDGETFCFLPLSERTGLSLHVNGTFAVLSNRRGIWWHGTEETRVGGKTDVEAAWNEKLINDCLIQSYISMLKSLSELLECREESDVNSFRYYNLWPNQANRRHAAWHTLADQFYEEVVKGSERIFCSTSNNGFKWISLRDCVILSNSVWKVLPHAQPIMKQVCPRYVELPNHVLEGLHKANYRTMQSLTVDEENFVSQWFAPHLQELDFQIRDDLLKTLLTRVFISDHLIPCLRSLALFPCSPDGQVLRVASAMIDPKCVESELFEEDERRFPVKGLCERDELTGGLRKLGMRSTGCFTWNDVVERSATVESLERDNHERAKRRIGALIKLMTKLCGNQETCSDTQLTHVRNTRFLFVEGCPSDYPIAWYADQHPNQKLVTPTEGYSWKCRYIVGSQAFIIDDFLQISSSAVGTVLGIRSLPPLSMLVKQLDMLISDLHDSSEFIKAIDKLYKELQRRHKDNEAEAIVRALQDKAWIVVGGYAMKSCQLAFQWSKSAPPYLSKVPSELSYMKKLLEATGVRTTFQPRDFVVALQQIYEKVRGERLPLSLVKYVKQLFIPEFSDMSELETFRGSLEVPLLSKDERLIPASRLAYNDAPWMDHALTEMHVYVHKCVPRATAEGLGVKLVREKLLDGFARDIPGRPFGQSEPLTKRLQNILEGYPADDGILKELVQNADDAKATEIHIIFDQRQHKTKRIFTDKWKTLQGPAICVYNNRPFTDADIEGIQNLGRGSKGDDPSLTGQYGIGFNAVYHLTDCPSFLSDNKTFCVLDPHCRYALGATKEKPGRLYDTNETFWSQFCDIWDCYKSFDEITLEGGTLFRLPLRTKEVAEQSLISQYVCDGKRVETMMDVFMQSAPSMLLFLNNVTCIKMTSISATSKVTRLCEVKANLSSEAEDERRRMSTVIAESKDKATADISHDAAFYEINIHTSVKDPHVFSKRNAAMEVRWLVHHSIGVPHHDDFKAIGEGSRMALLPRVGIAAPIGQNLALSQTNLFCFLPLPVCWNLPVQINGHFALDSTRRDLWSDSGRSVGSPRQKWNKDLIKFVLAPAYARFLLKARDYVALNEGDAYTYACLRKDLEWFHHLLPMNLGNCTEGSYVDLLRKELCVYLFEHNCPLLPYTGQPAYSFCEYMTIAVEDEKKSLKEIFPTEANDDKIMFVKWLEIGKKTDVGLLTGYFSRWMFKTEYDYALELILLRCGFPLVLSPYFLHGAILNAKEDASVEFVNCEAVRLFLKSHGTAGSCCLLQLGSLEETILKSYSAAELLLYYVVKPTEPDATSDANCEKRYLDLSGLPLLVTADGKLREFSTSSPVLVSRYSDLLPRSLDLFVHGQLISTLQSLQDPVLKKLSPSDLAEYLPTQGVFPPDWLVSDQYKEWNQAVGPDKKWISTLWSYLMEGTNLSDFIECLKDLPIISAGNGSLLVPFCLSNTVFWSLQRKPPRPFTDVCQSLLKVGAVEVGDFIRETYRFASEQSEKLVQQFADIDNVDSVVKAVRYLFNNRCREATSVIDAETILKYFQSNINSMNSFGFDELRKTPLFETLEGNLVSVPTDRDACTLPIDLISAGSDIWMSKASCTFLKYKIVLNYLYSKIGLHRKEAVDIYVDYILPCFYLMSQSVRVEHLVSLMKLSGDKNTDLIITLRDTPCFDLQGVPSKVADFYHPSVQVFVMMIPKEKFPPTPPESILSLEDVWQWLQFLVKLGLRTVCSTAEFLQFAELLENETLTWKFTGKEPINYQKWRMKSDVMVAHLADSMEKFWKDKFLANVAKIRFISSVAVNRKLEELALPFYKRDKVSNYATSYREGVKFTLDNEKLCWTAEALVSKPRLVYHVKNFDVLCLDLGIRKAPSVTSVLTHLSCLIETVRRNIQPEKETRKETVLCMVDILSSIFRHLAKFIPTSGTQLLPFTDLRNSECFTNNLNTDARNIVELLTASQCIFLPDQQLFVKPYQVVISTGSTFHPYLFRCPRYLVAYEHLLKRIGVDEEVRVFHCARILEAIHERYQDSEVNLPGDVQMLKPLVKLLFTTLKSEVSLKTISPVDIEKALQPLFLPSREMVLTLSERLVYLDLFHLEKHVDGLPFLFLIDLRLCGLSSLSKETVDLLPETLRLRNLSQLTEEILDPECCLSVLDECAEEDVSAVAARYEAHLTSSYFVHGVRSIYIWSRNEPTIPETLERGLDLLKNHFHVKCVPEIRTCLRTTDGKVIKLEGSRKCCFLERSRSEATLYVEANSLMEKGSIKLVALIVSELQILLQTELPEMKLLVIVSCQHPHLIPDFLTDVGIPYECNLEDFEDSPLCFSFHPGMEVIPDHLALLRQSPLGYRFNIDEWVAYELDDDRFVYAVILYRACSDDETESELLTHYGIDMGKEEPVVVSVLSLYAIVLETKLNDGVSMVLRDDSQPSNDSAVDSEIPQTLQDKKDLVRRQLEEIWKLSESDRKRAIRRMYLEWHPDKTDDPDAEEVFKFLLNEIERLERGGDISSEGGSPFWGGSYRAHYPTWNSYARRHRRRFRSSRSRSRNQTFPSYHPNSSHRQSFNNFGYSETDLSPNRHVGVMFVEQAEADLSVAETLISSWSDDARRYAAVCFFCHEVVEKALKGLLYIRQGIPADRRRKNNIGFFLGAGDLPGCPSSLKRYAVMVDDNYYVDTRYPDSKNCVPASAYSRQDAEHALEGARGVMKDTRTCVSRW